jgi:uncharacterized protein (DUF362 family)
MVDQAISNLLELFGGIGSYVKPGDRVLLKPNLLGASHADDPTATHHTVMHSLLRQIQSVGGKPYIGDSPAFGNVTTVARKSGLMKVAEELGVPITDWPEECECLPRNPIAYAPISWHVRSWRQMSWSMCQN